jgi:hypothetical protein
VAENAFGLGHGAAGDIEIADAAGGDPEVARAVALLSARAPAWLELSLEAKIELLDRLLADTRAVAAEWVEAACIAKRLSAAEPLAGEEWMAGPVSLLAMLRHLRRTLSDLHVHASVRLPGPVRTRSDGQAVAPVFPRTTIDRLLLRSVRADVWMDPAIAADEVTNTLAVIHSGARPAQPGVALVLGGGNVSSIPALDALSKLFADGRVVLLKLSPVNDYLTPLVSRALAALIEGGFLRVFPDTPAARRMAAHPAITDVHVTGSVRTYNAIVFGDGTAGRARRARGERLIDKHVTAELGNVMPVIVVPGEWSHVEIAYQAEHIAAMLVNNAGFNCVAARVLVTWRDWPHRDALLDAIRRCLRATPLRAAYYPGAVGCFERFVGAHPETEMFGHVCEAELPWAFIPGLDASAEAEPCFTTEPFCGLFAEVALAAESATAFVEAATAFANERLSGTLATSLLVQPASLRRDVGLARAVDRAVARLRYGFVGINLWAGVSFVLGTTTWGAFPAHRPEEIGSGVGVVHNALLIDRPQKTVGQGPFRTVLTPAWFARHRQANVLGRLAAELECKPSPRHLPPLVFAALRG